MIAPWPSSPFSPPRPSPVKFDLDRFVVSYLRGVQNYEVPIRGESEVYPADLLLVSCTILGWEEGEEKKKDIDAILKHGQKRHIDIFSRYNTIYGVFFSTLVQLELYAATAVD